ncbi:MAG: hypothetical protein JST82_01610 [Bacteroidetes bacterium]|nr:hypothetical protein [Bacteroidota bacterium]
MLIFLLYTIIGWIANACLVKLLFVSIQPGQWIDKLLNWQKRLQEWDKQGKIGIVKIGGYCEICFSHFLTFIAFWCYMLFMKIAVGQWITDDVHSTPQIILINAIWYLVYVSIGTNLSLYFISKLFSPKQ